MTGPEGPHAYRLGLAVKILGGGGIATHDARRHASGPHLSRSVELLDAAFDYLDRYDLRMYRLASGTVPYGTHPDLPHLDYRRQLDEAGEAVEALGRKAARLGLRLSTHPGQYTVINAADDELVRKSLLDLEQDAALLDALGQGPEAVVVVHVGGLYGDRAGALDRWARAYESLSDGARARVVVEHDETRFDVADVLALHRRTGVRVVYDHHHHRCLPAAGLAEPSAALAAAAATWPVGQRPEVHLSSPRTALRPPPRGRPATVSAVAPLVTQHADFASPWDAAELLRLLPRPADVMVEAKAKDLAVLWLRDHLARLFPELAAAETRGRPAPEAAAERDETPASAAIP